MQEPVTIRQDVNDYVDCEYVSDASHEMVFALTASDNSQSYHALRPYLTQPIFSASPEGSIVAVFEHGEGWSLSFSASTISNEGKTAIIGLGEGLATSSSYVCGAVVTAGNTKVLESATRAGTQIVRDWCANDTRLHKADGN